MADVIALTPAGPQLSSSLPCEATRDEGGFRVRVHPSSQAKTGMAEELARRIKEGAIPIISDVGGFIAYYVETGIARL